MLSQEDDNLSSYFLSLKTLTVARWITCYFYSKWVILLSRHTQRPVLGRRCYNSKYQKLGTLQAFPPYYIITTIPRCKVRCGIYSSPAGINWSRIQSSRNSLCQCSTFTKVKALMHICFSSNPILCEVSADSTEAPGSRKFRARGKEIKHNLLHEAHKKIIKNLNSPLQLAIQTQTPTSLYSFIICNRVKPKSNTDLTLYTLQFWKM